MFKYLYFLFYRYYQKGRYGDTARLSASIALAMTQCFMLICTALTLRIFVDMTIFVGKFGWLIKLLCLFMAYFFVFYNNKKYGGEIKKLEEQFKDYSANKWMKIWMIMVLNLFLLLFPFVLSAIIRYH